MGAALALFASMKTWPWGLIWRVGVVLLVIGIGWWLRDSGVREGVARANREWEARMVEHERAVHAFEQQRNEMIGQIRRDAARRLAQITAYSEQGQNEIEAATPADEVPMDPQLVAAWRGAIDRLCVYPDPNGNLPNSCSGGATA